MLQADRGGRPAPDAPHPPRGSLEVMKKPGGEGGPVTSGALRVFPADGWKKNQRVQQGGSRYLSLEFTRFVIFDLMHLGSEPTH